MAAWPSRPGVSISPIPIRQGNGTTNQRQGRTSRARSSSACPSCSRLNTMQGFECEGGWNGKSHESSSRRTPHRHAAARPRQRGAGHRLVQEGPWCRRSGARRRPGREDHARGDPHRRFAHHAERPDRWRKRGPKAFGGSPASLWLYVEDCDALFNRAVAAGGHVRPGPMGQLTDQFWGDRSGTFTDPYGYEWTIATHKEDVTPDEMKRRTEEFMKSLATPQPAHR